MNKTIAVGGGKGGVGKSLVAANLAISAAQLGQRVVVIDTDLGGANLDTIFGIQHPKKLLEQFIQREVERLEDLLIETDQSGLSVICGGMPKPGSANPKHSQKVRLIRHIARLDADVVVLDIGAGVGYTVLDLFNAASLKLVVLTSQLTSLHNGYGFLKSAILRDLQSKIAPDLRHHLIADDRGKEEETLADTLERLARLNAGEADKARKALASYSVYLIGNMLRSPSESSVIASIGNVIHYHLQIKAPVVGAIRYSDKIHKSVNERRPFMFQAGGSANAEAFHQMTARLLAEPAAETSSMPGVPAFPDSTPTGMDGASYEREDARYPVKWRVLLELGGEHYAGQMSNIAYGGTLVDFAEPVDGASSGAKGYLTVGPTLNGVTATLKVEERHRDDSSRKLGFAFCDLEGADGEMLEKLVAIAAASVVIENR